MGSIINNKSDLDDKPKKWNNSIYSNNSIKSDAVNPIQINAINPRFVTYGYIRCIFELIKNDKDNENCIIYSIIPKAIFDLCTMYRLNKTRHLCMLSNSCDNVYDHIGLATSLEYIKDINHTSKNIIKTRCIFKDKHKLYGSYHGCKSLYVNNIEFHSNNIHKYYNGIYDVLFLCGGYNYTIHPSNDHYDYEKGWKYNKDKLNRYAIMILFDNDHKFNKEDIPSWDDGEYDKNIYAYYIQLPWSDRWDPRSCSNLVYLDQYGLIVTINKNIYHLKLFGNLDELKWCKLEVFENLKWSNNTTPILHIVKKGYSQCLFMYDGKKNNVKLIDLNSKEILNIKCDENVVFEGKSIYDEYKNVIYFINGKSRWTDTEEQSYYFDLNNNAWNTISSPSTFNYNESTLYIKFKDNVSLLYVIDYDDQMEFYNMLTNKWSITNHPTMDYRDLIEGHQSFHLV